MILLLLCSLDWLDRIDGSRTADGPPSPIGPSARLEREAGASPASGARGHPPRG